MYDGHVLINKENLILSTHGPIIGKSIHTIIDTLVYVVPAVYGKLSEKDRYQIARVIGKIVKHFKKEPEKTVDKKKNIKPSREPFIEKWIKKWKLNSFSISTFILEYPQFKYATYKKRLSRMLDQMVEAGRIKKTGDETFEVLWEKF